VQEKQRALGKTEVCPFAAHQHGITAVRSSLTERWQPCSDYMRLPASQYSVLDAKKIERLDDDTFICYVGGLNFLGFVVEPVLTVSVIVQDKGPVVKLLGTEVNN